MYLRAHAPVVWRCQTEAQLGVDPSWAVRLDNLDQTDQAFLSALPHIITRQSLYRARRVARMPMGRANELMEQLTERGLLVSQSLPPASNEDVYWERLGVSRSQHAGRVHRARVVLLGTGRLASLLAQALLDAGVGTLLTEDPVLVSQLTRRYPGQHIQRGDDTVPDLAILVCAHVMDPLRERALTQDGIRHLPVVIGEVVTAIGPCLSPASPLCRSCIELWHCEEDPCWPAVATQARVLPPPQVDPLVELQAAAAAARIVVDCLCEDGEHAWEETSLEVGGCDVTGRLRRWRPHPRCLCAQRATHAPRPTPSPEPAPASASA